MGGIPPRYSPRGNEEETRKGEEGEEEEEEEEDENKMR